MSDLHRVRGSSRRAVQSGMTLVEVLVAMVLALVVTAGMYFAFNFLFARKAPSSLTTLTDRSFVNKDLRIAMRKLFRRLREGTQILTPLPGKTSPTLEFRDILNDRIRIRLLASEERVISERFIAGAFQRETLPRELTTASGETIRPCYPIKIDNCANLSFTATSPTCVVVHLTLTWRNNMNTLATSISMRNANLAY